MTDPDLSKVDREAFQRAIDLTLAETDKDRVSQVRSMLETREWIDVANFCSYHRQYHALSLRPWEEPPCWIDIDEIPIIMAVEPSNNQRYRAAKLTRQLLDAGLSQFEPDPLQALAKKKERKRVVIDR
jgi:hypothetical protein